MAIFLDDLQWADSASLSLIQNLIEDDSVSYLFLMLAYRDNEIDRTHPFQVLLEEIEKTDYKIEKILLKPLNDENVRQLLEDSLHSQSNEVSEIASLVLSKTGGNPFFINEFLKKLYRSELIQFNYDKAVWNWKIDEIKNVKVSENIVELLIDKISILPDSIQNILQGTLVVMVGLLPIVLFAEEVGHLGIQVNRRWAACAACFAPQTIPRRRDL